MNLRRFSQILLFFRLNNPSFFSILSSYDRCSNPLTIFFFFSLSLAPICPFLSCTGDTSTRHNTLDLVSPGKSRGEQSTFWWFLALCSPGSSWLSLLQEHIAGSWSIWCPLGHQDSRSFSVKLLSSQSAPGLCWHMGLFLLWYKASNFSLLNSMRLLAADIQPVKVLPAQIFGASTTLRCFVLSVNFLRMHFLPTRSLITFFFFDIFSPFISQAGRRLELQSHSKIPAETALFQFNDLK